MRFWMSRSSSLTLEPKKIPEELLVFSQHWKPEEVGDNRVNDLASESKGREEANLLFIHVLLFGLPPESVVQMKVQVTLFKKKKL